MSTDLDGAVWKKARASDNQGNCVEVARADHVVGVRDSKDKNGGILRFDHAEWATFCAGMRAGNFE